jgi:hypothetical protein
MIRAKICFAAVAVVRDAETNGISAFNILEGVVPVGMPFFMQQLAFFVLWERDANDPQQPHGEFTVEIAGNRLATVQLNLDFQDKPRHRSIVNLNGLTVPQPGQLRFSITLETGARAEFTMDVEAPHAVPLVRQ